MSKALSFKNVYLGGGNSAGYAAWQWVKQGGPRGELAIVGEEPVSSWPRAMSRACCTRVPAIARQRDIELLPS